MKHTLLCPKQLRAFGIVVEDTPRQFDMQSSHSITVPGENVIIPLELQGVILYFESHRPTDDELDNCCCLVLCSDVPWNPNDPSFAQQEQAMVHHSRISAVHQHGDSVGGSLLASLLPTPAELLSDQDFACRLIAAVNIAGDDWSGDGTSGYADEELFPIGDQHCKVFAMSLVDKQSVITKEVLA